MNSEGENAITKDQLLHYAEEYLEVCRKHLLLESSIKRPPSVYDSATEFIEATSQRAHAFPTGTAMVSRLFVYFLFPNLTKEEQALLERLMACRADDCERRTKLVAEVKSSGIEHKLTAGQIEILETEIMPI